YFLIIIAAAKYSGECLAPNATKPEKDLRNRNKDPTPKIRWRWNPTPRLISQNSWTDQGRKEEIMNGRNLENHETDNDNEEILDRNGGSDSEIFGIMENNYLKKFHIIRIYLPMERQPEYQQSIAIVIDNEIQGNRRRNERIQDNVRRRIEREHYNIDQKETNQMVQPDIHDKESKQEIEKDTGCESVEQGDGRLQLQDARFERGKKRIRFGDWSSSLDLRFAIYHLIVQTESQPYLSFEFQNNYYTYRAMPFGTKHSPLYFAAAMEPITQQIRMKTEIRIISYVDDIFLFHQNKEYLRNVAQKVIDTLKYFGFTINAEKIETESKQTIIFLGLE
ncbi:MAG: hypothetical protein EZS28_035559, partial [Streblomastix strix]